MTTEYGRVGKPTGLSSDDGAQLHGLHPSGFDPSRWTLCPIIQGTLHRGWQVMRDGKPISGLFDEFCCAVLALEEFRSESRHR